MRGTFEGHPRTVFDLFGPRGYRIVSSQDATAVCPPRWCPGATPKGLDILTLLESGRLERLRRFLRAIRPGRPSFYLNRSAPIEAKKAIGLALERRDRDRP